MVRIGSVFVALVLLTLGSAQAQNLDWERCFDEIADLQDRDRACTAVIDDPHLRREAADIRLSALRMRVEIRMDLDMTTEPLADLNTIIAKGQGDALSFGRRGLLLRIVGDLDAAIRDLEQASTLDPEWGWPHRLRALSLDERGDHSRALFAIDAAIRLAPDDFWNWITRAEIAENLEDLQTAIEGVTEAVSASARAGGPDMNDQLIVAHRFRARLYDNAGDPASAQQDYQIAVNLAPDDAELRNALAWTSYKMGDYETGLPHAERAVELEPENFHILDTLANLHAGLGDHDLAMTLFERAMEVGGADVVTFYRDALNSHGYEVVTEAEVMDEAIRSALEQCLADGCRVVEGTEYW